MMGRSPRCCIPSLVGIGLLVPEKTILKVFTIYRHGGNLGHVTSIILTNLHCHVSKSLHTNLIKNGPVVSEKSKF